MQHPQLPVILKALRQYFDELYGERLVNLMLFGSQARAEAEPDSDIDLLVVLKGDVDAWAEIKRTGEAVATLCLEYNVVICCIFVAESQFQAQKTALLRNVNREGVPV